MVLLGLGLREFSMNPIFIPKVKKALRSVETGTLEKACREALDLRSAQEIEEFVIESVMARHPDAFLMSGDNGGSKKRN
jgi:phosphoenolpyruvate-protein phosphotransferase (PTS system enzyme I)